MAKENIPNSVNDASLMGIVLDDCAVLTLVEISQACAVQVGAVVDLVEEGVLTPEGEALEHWRFTGIQLRRAGVALRLQQDLGINPAGVALVLQLLDELEVLRALHNKPDYDD